MIKNITFGSDPEFFVINEISGKIVSAIPLVNGTKEEPESLGDGYFIQRDNILVEGNVPVTTNKADYIQSILELKRRIVAYLKNKYQVLNIRCDDCADIDTIFLSHPEAMLFGCSPYLNAWDSEVHKAGDLSSESYRTVGFHQHIGYDLTEECPFPKEIMNKIIARAFDLFIVIPSALVHVDKRRFENYGGLGQYRDTKYGLECRSLGSFFSNDIYLNWVFNQMEKVIKFCSNKDNAISLLEMQKPETKFMGHIFAFNSNDYKAVNIDFNEQVITEKLLVNAGN